MDLKVLMGTGHCVLDIPKPASVNVWWFSGGEIRSHIFALDYTVLGRSDSPFVFGVEIAERLIIATSRGRPRFRSPIGGVIFALVTVSHDACFHPVIARAMSYASRITCSCSYPKVPVANFRLILGLDDYVVPLPNVNDDIVDGVRLDWH